MPTIPIRGVGEVGIVADLSPLDLPITACTDARNVRFERGIISRYSVFKKLNATYAYSKVPVGIFEDRTVEGQGNIITVFSDGTMEQFFSDEIRDVTPTGTLGVSTSQITTALLGGIMYVHRDTDVPIYRTGPGAGDFSPIPGWDNTDRALSVRSYRDFLIAVNVTKDDTQYPGMVKWSDAAQAGVPPSNWDVTSPSSLAGETILNDLRGELVDGVQLSSSFILYGDQQTYRMDFVGEPFVFQFDKVFPDQGMIAKNCAVEIDGKHYVFGRSDIFIHDGTQKVSISNGRIQRFVFDELDFEQRDRCFVFHDHLNYEVVFCYPTQKDDVQWPLSEINGCNRAAVYNYKSDTWSIVDIPALTAACAVSLSSVPTWEDSVSWSETSASWNSFAGQKPRMPVITSAGYSAISQAAKPYLLDRLSGGILNNDPEKSLLWPAYFERTLIDLDELGTNLYGRKLVKRIVPQIKSFAPEDEVVFRVGKSSTPSEAIQWADSKTLKPWSEVKYDCRVSARYLSLRTEFPEGVDAHFIGYDADIMKIAGR